MQKNIHPTFYENATVVCACGETFETGSTLKTIKVEICSKCHPFFTGKVKVIDTAGRVEKFQKKFAGSEDKIGAKVKPQKRTVKATTTLTKDKKKSSDTTKAKAKAKEIEASAKTETTN